MSTTPNSVGQWEAEKPLATRPNGEDCRACGREGWKEDEIWEHDEAYVDVFTVCQACGDGFWRNPEHRSVWFDMFHPASPLPDQPEAPR